MKLRFKDVEHLIRLSALLAAGLVVFAVVRWLLVPEDFGVFGHYRASAIDANRAKAPVYAGQQACADCHSDVVELRAAAKHAAVSCESCHGAAGAHAAAPETGAPPRPDAPLLCARCHAANTGKPAWYRTVNIRDHAGDESCISCHKPHDPRVE